VEEVPIKMLVAAVKSNKVGYYMSLPGYAGSVDIFWNSSTANISKRLDRI
jgi:hypothetical protein